MSKACPDEFRRDVVAVARKGQSPVTQVANPVASERRIWPTGNGSSHRLPGLAKFDRRVGASECTLSRRFRDDVGMANTAPWGREPLTPPRCIDTTSDSGGHQRTRQTTCGRRIPGSGIGIPKKSLNSSPAMAP